MGMKIAKLHLEKSLEDYKVTLERIAMALWDESTVSTWEKKGSSVCRALIGEAEAALRKAKDREATETRLQIMQAGRDKFIYLAESVQDEAEERSREELVDLENEVVYNKDNATSMAQLLKGTTDPEIAGRAEKGFKVAVEAAGNSCKCLDSLRMRLDFQSVDSKAESYQGRKQASGKEARDTQAGGQGRSEPSEPQCEPEARRASTRGQTNEGRAQPSGRDSFFRSG
jgi:hypothetical protein